MEGEFIMKLREDARAVYEAALAAALPDVAVRQALTGLPPVRGRLVLLAVGKAAWQMAAQAKKDLGERIGSGIVITKHGHSGGAIDDLVICEAGHPIPDDNSYAATAKAVELVRDLTADDMVLFLLSGGGSSLFEQPLLPAAEMDSVTRQLLSCGADIVEMNTLRKRFSAVKGGKLALLCAPARIFAVVLSDIVGDPLDMIASGPAYPDSSTRAEALAIVEKYGLKLSPEAIALLDIEPPKELPNVQTRVIGSVRLLCDAARSACERLGYRTVVLTSSLTCEAREAGSFLAAIARHHADTTQPLSFIAGGETVVRVTGKGLGGRNQELALAGARGLEGLRDVLLFSVGSDGTDGPTDAAGGMVDGETMQKLRAAGLNLDAVLRDNDAYHALQAVDGLIVTGPTGTNVNDVACLLVKR